jgi:LacI family transcriptional regulator, galactose operon repressor
LGDAELADRRRWLRAKATINDIARLSGVSKKTVSRVINRSPLVNDETRSKVDAVIQKAGYVPNPQARALALRRNFLIGLIHDNPNPQTVLTVQQGILDALASTEYSLLVRPVYRGSATAIEDIQAFLDRQRLHGVIFMPPLSENGALAELCERFDCRYVRMGSAQLDRGDRSVCSNDRELVRQATTYLISLGHRRIGIVEGPKGFRSALERRSGFSEALVAANLPLGDELVAPGDYRFESGLLAGEKLLGIAQPPTAIFASNDEMAAGVLHAARKRKLSVPEDLSIVGFDDNPIAAHIWPPLTTVRWPIAAMARAATFKLLAGTPDADEDAAEQSQFASQLINRASVAAPKR